MQVWVGRNYYLCKAKNSQIWFLASPSFLPSFPLSPSLPILVLVAASASQSPYNDQGNPDTNATRLWLPTLSLSLSPPALSPPSLFLSGERERARGCWLRRSLRRFQYRPEAIRIRTSLAVETHEQFVWEKRRERPRLREREEERESERESVLGKQKLLLVDKL